jgi:cysteine desulfurase / selenocysteine lyase
MTTPTSTATSGVASDLPLRPQSTPSVPEQPDPSFEPDVAGVPTPTGLPDVAVLASLANEFFAALPGHSLPENSTLPEKSVPGVTSPPRATGGRAGVPPAAPTPASAPSPADAPSSLVAIPALPGAAPPAHSEVPLIGGAPAPAPAWAPSAPYYFLGEASAPPAVAEPIGAGTPSFGFPGEAELQALLTVLPADLAADQTPAEHLDRYFVQAPAEHPERYAEQAPAEHPERYFARTAPGLGAADRHPQFDVDSVRGDFPILSEQVNGRQLVWLDNAATTQKPRSVIERLAYFYEHENSNVHRAAHELAARATDAYEGARSKVARLLGAGSTEEIVFVRGATEGINLIAQSWGRQNVRAGDEIVISHLEHHANIVPWQRLAAETGALLKVIPVDDSGQILLEEYQKLLGDRTKIVSVAQVSNALGTVTPTREIVELGHRAGACVVVDGAQSVSHMRVDVRALGADFFVFSGHKIYGPTGIGAVYGKASVLDAMPPWQSGGNMIRHVTLEHSTYQDPPQRFEAGTGNIADAVGLGAALDYLERLGIENVERYEHDLLVYATRTMLDVAGLQLIGTSPDKASVLSFVLAGYTPQQVGEALSRDGIAVRAGNHCAQPILRRFGLEASVRASLAFYNTTDEVDQMVGVLHRLVADSGRGRRS